MAESDDEERGATSEVNTTKPVVVGIGASAGGVQALQALFGALPEKTGAAFVVVVHLDPNQRSEMASILAQRTHMPVLQVGEPVPLQADHVYVIPPDRRLHITDNEIASAEFEEPRGRRAPIDLFFRSVADQHGDGFAVILTGSGSDGAVGVRAVKESGGIILVQDPDEAEFPSMPRSAIATGIADFVLPLYELAECLAELVREKSNGSPKEQVRNLNEELLRRILSHVRVRTGHDFSKYKRATILRRIARRMQVTRSETADAYYDALRDNHDEAQALLGDLLISVTSFFRDKEAFKTLELEVVPQLLHGKRPDRALRVWVPGCATGEEVYSISMLLLEQASRRQDIRPTIQVFGSDIDTRALATARDGQYPAAIEADVSEDRLRRFFVREVDQYRVRQELRDLVLFANHSLLKDPPFSRIDLIACRNVLIYLDRELQELACGTFHYALNPHGFLMLGTSESADHQAGLFSTFDRKARIYQSLAVPGELRLLPRLPGNVGMVHEQGAHPIRSPSTSSLLNEAAAHRQALEKLATPSILVDQSHRVLHMSDNAGRFLQPSGGPLSGNVVDLVRPELRFELRSALHRVFQTSQPWLSLPIPVQFNGAPHRVLMQVKPADDRVDNRVGKAVVLFIEGGTVEATPEGALAKDATGESVATLREELRQAHARLRITREESDSSNEELRAANEELQSINEEYLSTSEELETSKEELQSINEELQTVNSELKLKLEMVSRSNSDLQNLMAATDFGILFLDSSLRIRRFTLQVTELFSITPSDEDRPISDFAHRLEYESLANDARAVLANLATIKREIRSRSGRWYDVRLRPYRSVDNKIDGVVVTFVDMTDRRHAEQALRQSERNLRHEKQLVDLSRDPVFIWDFDGTVLEWNRGSEELYGYSRDEAVGRKKNELLCTVVPRSSFDELREKLRDEGHWSGVLYHKAKDGRELIIESRIILESIDGRQLALESTRDVTERKAWELQQRLLLRELTHRVKNTLAVVQAIAHQTQRSSKSFDEFTDRFDGRLAALAAAHSLLVDGDWRGADLSTLAHRQLEPYTSSDSHRIRIVGEPVFLPADLATPFALVFHELATNAAKHGAFSRQGGFVELSWTLRSQSDQPFLTIIWRERGGPEVKEPTTTGFGSELVERAIPNAKVSHEFGSDGMVCTIALPLPKEL